MPPLEELQHSLAATIADLEASIGVDPNVVARFEKLSKEVSKLCCAETCLTQFRSLRSCSPRLEI